MNSNTQKVVLDGKDFTRIEGFDSLNDFFMTITSSSDIWNFCWAQGGITAGRKDKDHALFTYATADRVRDFKETTGSFTVIRVKKGDCSNILYQPFSSLLTEGLSHYSESLNLKRNIYKSLDGDEIWFEEINASLGIAFRYGWTSSEKYGLVRMVAVKNLTEDNLDIEILDGTRNILPSGLTASIQNEKSILADAYKKTEAEKDAEIALFSLSSLINDTTEPHEALRANISWFTTDDPIIVDEEIIGDFVKNRYSSSEARKGFSHGKRNQAFIVHRVLLEKEQTERWYQVLDTDYDAAGFISLKEEITNRKKALILLEEDIRKTHDTLDALLKDNDAEEQTSDFMADLHHRTNIMFNIMRGGTFHDGNSIHMEDFRSFVSVRNKGILKELEDFIEKNNLTEQKYPYKSLKELFDEKGSPDLRGIFLEYLPLYFSRRHGDPSRPWNNFNINLKDAEGKTKLDYEGNWRDIFQNWEALCYSYPLYAQAIMAKFVNAMTADGFNPYRITRSGIDWEVPEKDNPWSFYGYWGDHQVIYLEKILEFLYDYDRKALLKSLDDKIFTTSAIPYRFKSEEEVFEDPKHSLYFDYDEDKRIKANEKTYGTDARLILDEDGSVQRTDLLTKLLAIITTKCLNFIPGAGIWMNTQRPEWNDANNALSGFGCSAVTQSYLYRMMGFVTELLSEYGKDHGTVNVDGTVFNALEEAAALFSTKGKDAIDDGRIRKDFVKEAQDIFHSELPVLYKEGFCKKNSCTRDTSRVLDCLKALTEVLKQSILSSRTKDGLFHSYFIADFAKDYIGIKELPLMLEGQVAVLSSGLLDGNEALQLLESLRNSSLYENRQESYLLYPVKELLPFEKKNIINDEYREKLSFFADIAEQDIIQKDCMDNLHFNADLINQGALSSRLEELKNRIHLDEETIDLLSRAYEDTFRHSMFTGRSLSFYAYEGIGSIYWHMVSKLYLAAEEVLSRDFNSGLYKAWKNINKGLGYRKSPELYGAFPQDPYSHTPKDGGASQPGMTGQVKEEIIARFMELGLNIDDGKAVFNPLLLDNGEYKKDGTLDFYWCAVPVTYDRSINGISVFLKDMSQRNFEGNTLDKETSAMLFEHADKIQRITVGTKNTKSRS